jgi:Icc-related predicted phosphoesterase
MKILCVSDYIDPLVYSTNIKTRFKDVSLVIGCGDLPLDYYDFIISSLNKPLFFVFGNHNLKRLPYYDPRYRFQFAARAPESEKYKPCGGRYLSGRVSFVNGLIIAGLGGSMCYNNGPNQFTERDMFFYMLRLLPSLLWHRIVHGRFLDILVTHAPPYGIHDWPDVCHTGFKSFLWFMRHFKPTYLVHGHIHLYSQNAQRKSRYLQTTVINAFKHFILDTEENNE